MRMTKACLLLRAQAELKQLKGEPEQPEKVQVPEAPALDVKWMVCPKVAKKLYLFSLKIIIKSFSISISNERCYHFRHL
jgi:hypothetical protein